MLRADAKVEPQPFKKGSLGDDGIGKKLLEDGESGFVLVNDGEAKLFKFVELVECRRDINKLLGFRCSSGR